MRVTGGVLKNRAVRVVDRPDLRPTSARVREAVFHRLAHRLDGARVLDAFGGSGILSLEAWSRGAAAVVCVERDKRAVRQLHQTVRALGAEGVRVVGCDLRRLVEDPFDLVLADPPYKDDPKRWLSVLAPFVAGAGVLVFEHRAGALPRGRHGALSVEWQRRYGDTEVTFLEPLLAEATDATPDGSPGGDSEASP